ncbi:hypothetical protein [Methylorubrum extorquens]|uniref:Uncharacterized protein n=1 Tax=Methylorubrum extorquens (strain CM4 / NCIMB 13688) TaxID=440085 RepID=B7KXP4_METC4|nr:hypothetical protein [Methylorubrum extorquens]ACK84646.1 hypothetical protein Mchl_3830 [Methylorubrum extorquens CM4]
MTGLWLFGYACLTIITGAILATAGVLAWFIADRGLPVDVKETTVLTPVVRPGSKLVIRQRLGCLRNCSAYIDRALFDAQMHRVILPAVRYERPPQGLGPRTITFTVTVREEFGPGAGEYRAALEYHFNPLQRHYWSITRAQNVVRFQIERRS